jgi:hypothetical protein
LTPPKKRYIFVFEVNFQGIIPIWNAIIKKEENAAGQIIKEKIYSWVYGK